MYQTHANIETHVPPKKIEQVTTPSHPVCIRDPDIQYFMYHYVRYYDPHDTRQTHTLSVEPKNFEKQMAYVRTIADGGFIVLMQGKDFLTAVQKQCFPGKHIWIFSSDDGWVDSYTNLAPIATKYKIPFFFGIIQNRIDKWGFVTSLQIQELSKNPLFTIASHSLSHNDESKMSGSQERQEICQSKTKLEELIKIPVLAYIYPSGRMSANSPDLARQCGYTLAWSTHFGKNWERDTPDPFQVNRHPVHNTTWVGYFRNLLLTETTWIEVFVDGEE